MKMERSRPAFSGRRSFRQLVADFSLVRPRSTSTASISKPRRRRRPGQRAGWQTRCSDLPAENQHLHDPRRGCHLRRAGQTQPLRLSKLQVRAQDIRNVRSEPGDYPSPLHVEAQIFDRGRLTIDGHADFLAEPHAGVKGRVELAEIGLDYFRPVLQRSNILVTRGTFSGKGLVEYAPKFKKVDLEDLHLAGLQAEYLYHKPKAAVAKETVKTTAQAAKEVSNDPGVVLHAREMKLTDATVGFVNKDTTPTYRVFIANTDLTIQNFSNQKSEGYGQARLTGRFMGSGQTMVDLVMRAENNGPDVSLNAKIENTDVRAMNDVLRAHAKVDVASGVLSVYSEIVVKNAPRERLRQAAVQGPRRLRQGAGRRQEARREAEEKPPTSWPRSSRTASAMSGTIGKLEGPLENPKADTWEVLVNLVRNAFFQAIVPGFEGSCAPAGAERSGDHDSPGTRQQAQKPQRARDPEIALHPCRTGHRTATVAVAPNPAAASSASRGGRPLRGSPSRTRRTPRR